ncbi:MAG: hypothetical protein Q4B52_03855 [Tissierellia bacterium]|nr:hypothetical protein [Tissierellia bacterium]
MKSYKTLMSEKTGLSYDKMADSFYGFVDGFAFVIFRIESSNKFIIKISVDNENRDKNELKDLKNEYIGNIEILNDKIQFHIKGFKISTVANNTKMAMDTILDYLKKYDYKNICQIDKTKENIGIYQIENKLMILSDNCYQSLLEENNQKLKKEDLTDENIALGLIGAIGGMILGSLSILLIYNLGYVSAFGGIITAFLSIKGYEKLAGKLTKKGIFISSLIALFSAYLATRTAWSIEVSKQFNLDFISSFQLLKEIVKETNAEEFYNNQIFQTTIYTAVGVIISLILNMKKKRISNTFNKLT